MTFAQAVPFNLWVAWMRMGEVKSWGLVPSSSRRIDRRWQGGPVGAEGVTDTTNFGRAGVKPRVHHAGGKVGERQP